MVRAEPGRGGDAQISALAFTDDPGGMQTNRKGDPERAKTRELSCELDCGSWMGGCMLPSRFLQQSNR